MFADTLIKTPSPRIRDIVRSAGDMALGWFYYEFFNLVRAKGEGEIITYAEIADWCGTTINTAAKKIAKLVKHNLVQERTLQLGTNNTPKVYFLPDEPAPVVPNNCTLESNIGYQPSTQNLGTILLLNTVVVDKGSTDQQQHLLPPKTNSSTPDPRIAALRGFGVTAAWIENNDIPWSLTQINEAIKSVKRGGQNIQNPAGLLIATLKKTTPEPEPLPPEPAPAIVEALPAAPAPQPVAPVASQRVTAAVEGAYYTPEKAWSVAMHQLELQFDKLQWQMYLRHLVLVDYNPDTRTFVLAITSPDTDGYIRNHVQHRLYRNLRGTLAMTFGIDDIAITLQDPTTDNSLSSPLQELTS